MNNPIICIEDNFFKDFEKVRADLWQCEFSDLTLSQDGITYPYICDQLPSGIEYEFLYKLGSLLGVNISPRFLFARAMPEGTRAPGKLHSDRNYGTFTAHVCFSAGAAATSFMVGKELGYTATETTKQEDLERDTFSQYLLAIHEPNRLLVHHAAHFHCAEPESGFGTLKNDARLVLTCFFDVI